MLGLSGRVDFNAECLSNTQVIRTWKRIAWLLVQIDEKISSSGAQVKWGGLLGRQMQAIVVEL